MVLRWISGLAGFLNCCGMKYSRVLAANSSAWRTAPGMPFGRRRKHRSRPQGLEQPPAFQAHALGHRHHAACNRGPRRRRPGDARVAAGGLDDDRVGLDFAVPLGSVDHRPADAVLDAPQRIEFSIFAAIVAPALPTIRLSRTKRRVADALGNVIVNTGCRMRTSEISLSRNTELQREWDIVIPAVAIGTIYIKDLSQNRIVRVHPTGF